MSGVFGVPFAYTGSANVDLAEITAAAGKPCVILGYNIFQTSDAGDAQEENLRLLINTGATTSGSGGSSSTPNAKDSSNGAASFVAEQGNTTKASGGTITQRWKGGWNVRVADNIRFTQEEQVLVQAGVRATFEIAAAADSLAIEGELIVQEIG